MRRLLTSALATVLLSALLPVAARGGIPIEEAQREFQARYYFTHGSYVSWPACPCGTPAPAFPTNQFYGDLDRNPVLAVQLVQNLADNFFAWPDRLYGHFLNTPDGTAGIEGQASPPANYADSDFPATVNGIALSPVTLENWPNSFTNLLSYIQKLGYVGQSGSLTNLASKDERDLPAWSTTSCAEARNSGSDQWDGAAWAAQDIGPIAVWTESWLDSRTLPESTNYAAGAGNLRGSVYSPVGSWFPGFTSGSLAVYLNLAAEEGGTDGTSPPFTTFGAYHYFETRTIAFGGEYASATLAGSKPTIVGECSVLAPDDNPPIHGPAFKGWWLTDAFLVLKPDFKTDPDHVPCGGGGCATCGGGGNIPGKVSTANSSLDLQISLGPDSYGRSAGYFYLHADQASAALLSPASLLYSTPASTWPAGTGSATDNGGVFYTPNITAYVQTNSAGYAIYFTNNAAPYDLLSSVTIESSGTPNQMVITEVLGSNGAPRVIQFNYTANGPNSWTWDMIEGGGVRVESRTTTWTTPTNRADTVVVKDSNGAVAAQRTESYCQFPWGLTLVQQTLGTGASAQTTSWTYYTNAQMDGGGFGQLRQLVEPSGRWEQYTYDTAGRLSKKVAQFGNSAVGSGGDSANRVTQIAYDGNITTTVVKLLDTEIARTYQIVAWDESDQIEQIQTIQCATAGLGIGAADNQTNIVWETTSDSNSAGTGHAWDTVATLAPDGTMTLSQFNGSSTTVQSGDPGGTWTWADKVDWTPYGGPYGISDGTQTVTGFGGWGETTSVWVQDLASTLTLGQDTYIYSDTDPLRRSHSVLHLDNTTETFTWSCCGLDTYVDRDGATNQYFYDAAKRRTASTRLGILTTNVLDAAGNVLSTTRFGTDNSPIVLSQAAYDLAGRVLFETNALNGVTGHSETYGSGGRTVGTTYPDNGTRVELYNQDGSLQSASGTAVFPIYYEYGVDGAGAYTKETKDSPSGSEWTKTYMDMLGRAYKTAYASGSGAPSSTSYYSAQGQLTNQVDADGVSMLYAYNAKGEQTCSILDSNRNHQIEWTGTDRITLVTNDVVQGADVWDNAVIRRARTYQWAETGPVLVSETWASADGLRQASIAFGLTNEVRMVYAEGGYRCVTNTAPDGTCTTETYQNGRLMSSTLVNGELGASDRILNSTTYGYDEHGRQKTVTDGRNGPTRYTYRSNSDLLESVTTPSPDGVQPGQTTSFCYDKMLQATNVVQPDGASVFAEYYPTGLRKHTYGARVYPVAYTYDGQGRVQTMTTWRNTSDTNTAAVTAWSYDAYRGWLAGKTYNSGQTAGPTYSNTPAGRLASRTWARGIQTTYGYNYAGDLASITYSSGAANLGYDYDRRGRLATVTQGGTPITSLACNDAGQLLGESWLSGPLSGLGAQNLYDGFLRRTNTAVLNAQSATLAASGFGYDAASRLFVVSDGTSSATYTYVPMSPLVSQVAFARNGTSRLSTTKQWDLLNRLQSVSSAAASFGYGYNNANQRTNATLADNSRWVYGYDPLGQVTSGKKYWSDGSPVAGQQFDYDFDDIGNRNTTSTGGDSGGQNLHTANYTNNLLNQITSRDVPGYLQVLGSANSNATITLWSAAGPLSTPAGNFAQTLRHGEYYAGELLPNNSTGAVWLAITNLAVLRNGTNADYAATNVGFMFAAQTPETFGYDLDGNLTNNGRWSISWDAENRATSFTNLASNPAASKRKVDCAYDYAGRRMQKVVSTYNGGGYAAQSTNRFVYDGWNLVAILDATNGLDRSFTWGLDASGTTQGAGGVGGLISMTVHQGPYVGTYFYVYDGNHNVVALVSAADGSIAAQYEYSPFGKVLRATGPLAIPNPFLFSTKHYDWETGLYYYGYRYYDPSTGRWLSRDPLGEGSGLNLYAAFFNSPLNYCDRNGLDNLHPDPMNPTVFENAVNSVSIPTSQIPSDLLNPIPLANPAEADVQALEVTIWLLIPNPGQSYSDADLAMASAFDPALGWEDRLAGGLQSVSTVILGTVALVPGEKAVASLAKSCCSAKGVLLRTTRKAVVKFNGMEVRAARDLSHLSEATLNEMSQSGRAARTVNGDKIVLHHHMQNPNGPLVEMPSRNNSIHNPNPNVHPLGNAEGVGLTDQERAAFNQFRVEYWKARAKEELAKRCVR